MRRKLTALFTLMLAFVMITANAGLAEASTSRVAIISKLEGTVEVQKSGGKKTLKGFRNMSLNEGDIVSTGSKSSVELKFSNGTSTDDTLVLESNTTVTFSKLSNRNGTVTKVKMKSGKAWVDVKSIASSSDDFQLETPTAIMGVRGTNFFIGIDPNTGQSVLSMFAGIVQLQTEEDDFSQTRGIYPAQIYFTDPEDGPLVGLISNQSLEQILQQTSADTIRAVLESLGKIQQENWQLLDNIRNNPELIDGLDPSLREILTDERLRRNIANITAAILKAAVDRELITDSERNSKLQEVLGEAANEQDGTLVGTDPNDEYDFILNQKTQQMLEQLKQNERLGERKAELERQLAEQKKKLEEEKQKREQQALDKYLDSLNERQKEQFLQERDRVTRENTRPTPTPTPSYAPTPAPTPSTGWHTITEPFVIEQRQQSNEAAVLSYSRSGVNEFMLTDPIDVAAGYAVVFQAADDFILENVEISEVDSDSLGATEGAAWWNTMDETTRSFTATITLSRSDYYPAQQSFTLHGILLASPIQLELMNGQSANELAYSNAGVPFNYTVMTEMPFHSGHSIGITLDNPSDRITDVRVVNYLQPSIEGQEGKWILDMINYATDRTLYVEVDVEHMVGADVVSQTYIIEIPQGWEASENPKMNPIMLTLFDGETDVQLDYHHDAADYYSLVIEDPLLLGAGGASVLEGEEQTLPEIGAVLVVSIPLDEQGTPLVEYELLTVQIGEEVMELPEGFYFLLLPYGEYTLDMVITLYDSQHGLASFNLTVPVTSDEQFAPVDLFFGEVGLLPESYQQLSYISSPSSEGDNIFDLVLNPYEFEIDEDGQYSLYAVSKSKQIVSVEIYDEERGVWDAIPGPNGPQESYFFYWVEDANVRYRLNMIDEQSNEYIYYIEKGTLPKLV